MTDEDINSMVANNYGESVNSPWYGSSVHYNRRLSDKEPHDTTIDYEEEHDETPYHILPEEPLLDDLPDYTEDIEDSE